MKSTIYALSFLLCISAVSCRTTTGDPGPSGASTLKQEGTINGTLTYENVNGNPVSYTFDYQFYETDLFNNEFNYDSSKAGYVIELFRRDAKESANSFYMSFTGDIDTAYIQPTSIVIDFGFLKETPNGLFVFQDITHGDGDSDYVFATPTGSDQDAVLTISHYLFKPSTGQLSFDYEIIYNPDNVDDRYIAGDDVSPIVKGSVNVKVKRNPYNTNIPSSQPPVETETPSLN